MVYDFFRREQVEFIQFAPVVERLPGSVERKLGLQLAGPISPGNNDGGHPAIAPWSVLSEEYGDFLIDIYEEWVRHDVGKTFVMNFEWPLNTWIGNPSPICVYSRQRGQSLVVEYNGDVFACDHYVYPQYKLGNIGEKSLSALAETARNLGIGSGKENNLDDSCRECEVLAACRGGCPKHRFLPNGDGTCSRNYLCGGYRKFFSHIRKYLRVMSTLLENGYPASVIMEVTQGPLIIEKQRMQ